MQSRRKSTGSEASLERHGSAKLIESSEGLFLQISRGKMLTFYLVESEEYSIRLKKMDGKPSEEATVYNVSFENRDQPRCDCPDTTYRDLAGGCKHLKALQAVGLIGGAR